MNRRWIKVVFGAVAALVAVVLFFVVWVLYGPFSFASAAAKAKEASLLLKDNHPQRMLAEANRFYWGHNLPLATPLFARSAILFSQRHDPRDALYAKIGLMRSQDHTSFPDISSFIAQQLQTPMVQHDPFLRLWCLGVKGDADDETNVNAAAWDWEQARSLAEKLGQKEWANRATGELGIVAYLYGDYRTALARIGKALLTAAFEGDSGTEIRYLELVGNGLNGLNRPSEGMIFFPRAIRIANHDGYVGTPFMAYEGRAEALEAMGHRAEAQALMERTLAEVRSQKMWEHEGQDLLILGEFAMQSGNDAHARDCLNEAVESAQRMGMCRVVAQSYFDLSKLSEKEGNLQQAASETQQGVHYMGLAGDTIYLPRSLDALAELNARMGKAAAAHQLYLQAEGVIDEMLLRVPGAYAESSLLNAMSQTYLADFELAASQDNVDMAFNTIERARGRTVADMLRDHTADRRSAKAGGAYATKLASLRNELLQDTDYGQRTQALGTLQEDVEDIGYPDRVSDPDERRMTFQPIDFASAQRSLRSNEAVLEYVLGDPASFCLAFNHTSAAIVKLPAGKEGIQKAVADYLSKIAKQKDSAQVARRLYAMLLAPVPEAFRPKRLVIVPDGMLNNVPFGALRDAKGRYVIESHIVSYAPSATVLCYLRNRKPTSDPEMAFLGIGAVPYPLQPKSARKTGSFMHFLARGVYDLSGGRFGPLPATRNELVEADQALGHPKRSVLLIGAEATEAKFDSEPLANFKIIHFAVHGLFTPNFPERSGLILGRAPHSKINGVLEVRDITHLSLDADLVTLSACDTGTGKIQGEEGITGLVPAFLFAGARSVVGSLWEVDDSVTALEMKSFYEHLAEGQSPAEALRQAKLDYLHGEGDRPPLYWAGFILVGDGSEPIHF
jgi:CHAT domain-containing protein/tetratricopeptide (TPR) repeat protein